MQAVIMQQASQLWCSAPQQSYQDLVAALNREVANGAYVIPPAPVLDILGLCRNVEANVDRIEAQGKREPDFVARVLWLAQGPLYGDGGPYRTVRGVVERLGPSLAREILGHAAMSLYACQAQHFPTWRGQICAQAAGAGFACAALARDADRGGDWAFAAGVLHDIGKAVLIQIMSRLPAGLAAPGEMARRLLEGEHARVGRAVAIRHQLPGPLITAIARHHDYDAGADDDESAALVSLARRIWRAASSLGNEAETWPETAALGLRDYHVTRVAEQVVSIKPRLLALGGYLEEETADALAS